jgi:hypothetical protein
MLPANFPHDDTFRSRVTPDAQHVLFASVAHVMYNIFHTMDNTHNIAHLIASPADIPQYMREKIRAYAPLFSAMFRKMRTQCDFMLRLLETTMIGTNMATTNTQTTQTKDAGVARVNYASIGGPFNSKSDQINRNSRDILRVIMNGASAIIKSCSEALAAIGDQPHFFEVSRDSIAEYRAQMNADPVMPISSLMLVAGGESNALVPKYGINDPTFKYLYAIRGLYNQKMSDSASALSNLTALESMVNMFNKYSHGNIRIEADLARDLAQNMIYGFDFAANEIIIPRSGWKSTDIRASFDTAYDSSWIPTPFGHNAPAAEIIAVVESRMREDSIKLIVSKTLKESAQSENDIMIANIIDTGIVPFDIHVLARQMPLHLIWNYAFTFDAITAQHISEQMDFDSLERVCSTDLARSATIKSTRDALITLVTNPYAPIPIAQFAMVARMMIGATGIRDFGRPTFLSDQIMKRIFNLDPMTLSDSEVGPPSRGGAPTFNPAFIAFVDNTYDKKAVPSSTNGLSAKAKSANAAFIRAVNDALRVMWSTTHNSATNDAIKIEIDKILLGGGKIDLNGSVVINLRGIDVSDLVNLSHSRDAANVVKDNSDLIEIKVLPHPNDPFPADDRTTDEYKFAYYRFNSYFARSLIFIHLVLDIVRMRLASANEREPTSGSIARSWGALDSRLYSFYGMEDADSMSESRAREKRAIRTSMTF